MCVYLTLLWYRCYVCVSLPCCGIGAMCVCIFTVLWYRCYVCVHLYRAVV